MQLLIMDGTYSDCKGVSVSVYTCSTPGLIN